jgi:hypothetical protein
MAFKPGKTAYLAIDNPAGSLQNISAYADNIQFPQSVDPLDVTTFGTLLARSFIPGLADGGQVSVSGPLDSALGTLIAANKAAQQAGTASFTCLYGPGGSVSGGLSQTAEVLIASFNVTTGVGGRVEYSASLQITGAVANATF